MNNFEHYTNCEPEGALADRIDDLIDGLPKYSNMTTGDLIAAWLEERYIPQPPEHPQALGETTFVVTLDVSNTIRGSIGDLQKTAAELGELYELAASCKLKNIFGDDDARDADNVTLRCVKCFPQELV